MSVKDSYKQELLNIIHGYLPTCKAWLFGSRATGKQRAGSDIDLALDNGQKIPWSILNKIAIKIDDTSIPMSVDLVDLVTTSEEFKKEVLSKGILWTP